MKFEDGEAEWLSRIDYRHQPTSHIVFHSIENGYNIEIEKKFVEVVTQTVVERLQSRNIK